MRNPWPFTEDRPSLRQTSLHLSINHDRFMGDHDLSAVSKAKSGASVGMLVFKDRRCSKAPTALHLHLESDRFMVSPSSLVLVCGTSKLINFDPLAAMPCLILVDHMTCAFGSGCISTSRSPSLQQHQNMMQATVNTAISKAFVWSRQRCSALRCSIVTGSLLGLWEDLRASLAAP